jgi:hypothetical protein
MRVLIALTVFMGVLILAGLAVIIATIVHRLSAPKQQAVIAGPAVSGPAASGLTVPGHAAIAVPDGATLGSMAAVGNRLVLHMVTPGMQDRLITLDPTTGVVLETIDLVRATPAEKP